MDPIIPYLMLRRGNEALPPRVSSAEKLASILLAGAWLAELGRTRLARELLSDSSAILRDDDVPQEVRVAVFGSARRQARDGGGHWALALERLGAWVLQEDADLPRRARLFAIAFPALAKLADRVSVAVSSARAWHRPGGEWERVWAAVLRAAIAAGEAEALITQSGTCRDC